MSNIIKPHFYVALDDRKQIEVAPVVHSHAAHPEAASEEIEPHEVRQAKQWKDQILQDAESLAEERIRQAEAEAQQLLERAQQEIENWWNERRLLDDQVAEEARRIGFAEGFDEGREAAERSVQEQYREMVGEAKTVLEQAYHMKDEIIREAEPFLIDLSASIAEKVTQRQLDGRPEWFLELVKSMLARTREKGTIILCVSPADYAYIRDARDELRLALDSQAELQILPDASVGKHGCVVRTDLGSIDARIDTQLKEIKSALQQIASIMEGDEPE